MKIEPLTHLSDIDKDAHLDAVVFELDLVQPAGAGWSPILGLHSCGGKKAGCGDMLERLPCFDTEWFPLQGGLGRETPFGSQ